MVQQNRYGIATRDITPPVGVLLCGYLPRRSQSVGHPLRAEALVCDDGTHGWAIVFCDLLAVSRHFAADVRRAASMRTGLSPDAIMVSATHTHSGPNAFGIGWREYSEEVPYFRQLRESVVDAIVEAWERRAPGELMHARTSAPEIGSNRRVQQADGTWTNHWNDPEGTHTGYYDPTVELLGVRRPDGSLDGLLVAFGCHPVCFNSQNTAISADYPGYMKDMLEASGKVKTAMFAVTGHANIDPRHCVDNKIEVTRKNGEDLARIVLAALGTLKPLRAAGTASVIEPWSMPISWSLDGNSASYFQVNRAGETMSSALGGVAMGDLAVLCMPGETVSEYMEYFRTSSPFSVTIMFSVCNDFVGYLVTDAIHAEGAYESAMCPIRPAEQAVKDHGAAVLARLHQTIHS